MYRTNAHSQLFIKYINERMKSSLDQMYLINLFLAFKTFYFWNLTSAIHPRAFMWKEYYMFKISDKILSIINKILSNEWFLLQISDVFEKPWPGLGDPRSTDKLTGFHRNFYKFYIYYRNSWRQSIVRSG